ncbi:tetratricopeptide repeat protein [Lentzea sp. NEAU-D7]|uniref:tetratricopeptide repeat protein n=1 Tax=Lentzea sp. NEAU-D7 TaxID=2994667 RepID=UPI00224A9322|nr:tetratricopeptide repeat protein [Lentzea sp. NEAU-D7]MCX2951514.1 tetratricopeptide repeat protein [Lentzea sp. NEAU-D7]
MAGTVAGALIQTGTLTGGVHVHPPSDSPLVPRQLPAPPRMFTGRANELTALTAELDANNEPGATVVISAIGGTGGIGKTWLALHWAHQHLDRFPDGQLYIDLRGFAPGGVPVSSAAALRCFLDALGVGPAAIPVQLDAQMGLYRSLVAGRHMLILIDNAPDTEHIVPLLPGSPTCAVLVTSRRSLTGLITTHGAQSLNLDVLTGGEARELLARHLGEDRLAAEPVAVADLVDCCAGLPLALKLVAVRAARHGDFPLRVLAEELHDHAARLDGLNSEDTNSGIRAVFSWSYDALPAPAAALYGLLGLAPASDISLPAVTSLAAMPAADVAGLLRELEDSHLVTQRAPGRYQMHDLIRLHAAERCPAAARAPALRRLVDYYLHGAYAGDRMLYPHRQPINLAPPSSGVCLTSLRDEASALRWFDAERPCMPAIQRLAADQGWHDVVWQLAWALHTYYLRRGHLHEQVSAWRLGLRAAAEIDDTAVLALAHRRLGQAKARIGEHDEALRHLRDSLRLAEEAGDVPGQAHTHLALMRSWEQMHDDCQALAHASQALRLYERDGTPVWQAEALNAVAWFEARLGNHSEAGAHCREAMRVFDEHHYLEGTANSSDTLGYIAYQAGRYAEALHSYEHAIALYREIGHIYFEADTLAHLGQAMLAAGRRADAERTWRRCLELYQTQHRVSAADLMRERLTAAFTGSSNGAQPAARCGAVSRPDGVS